MVQGPAPDRPADGLQRFRADRRQKTVRVDMTLPDRFPGSEREAVRGFVEQYNAQWIVEKNRYLSPAQARQAWDATMSLRPAA